MRNELSKNEKIIYGPCETSRHVDLTFSSGDLYISNKRIIFEDRKERSRDCIINFEEPKAFEYRPPDRLTGGWVFPPLLKIIFFDDLEQWKLSGHPKSKFHNKVGESFIAYWAKSDIVQNLITIKEKYILTKKKWDLEKAEGHERLLEFEEAAEIYKQYGLDDELIRVRKEKRNKVKVDQTVIHGDYVDDRDTIVKDSVINRSNIGAGGSSKLQEIKELKELHDAGAIDDDEFQQMKKEILGK